MYFKRRSRVLFQINPTKFYERWETETALDELKTHLRGARIVLRSKTPEFVRQEAYGLLPAHFAIRGLMHDASLKADVDADQLSFLHSVHVVERKLQRPGKNWIMLIGAAGRQVDSDASPRPCGSVKCIRGPD